MLRSAGVAPPIRVLCAPANVNANAIGNAGRRSRPSGRADDVAGDDRIERAIRPIDILTVHVDAVGTGRCIVSCNNIGIDDRIIQVPIEQNAVPLIARIAGDLRSACQVRADQIAADDVAAPISIRRGGQINICGSGQKSLTIASDQVAERIIAGRIDVGTRSCRRVADDRVAGILHTHAGKMISCRRTAVRRRSQVAPVNTIIRRVAG